MPTSRADARFHQDSIKKWSGKERSLVCMRKREGKTAPLAQAGALCGGRGTQFVRHIADDLQAAALRLFEGEG